VVDGTFETSAPRVIPAIPGDQQIVRRASRQKEGVQTMRFVRIISIGLALLIPAAGMVAMDAGIASATSTRTMNGSFTFTKTGTKLTTTCLTTFTQNRNNITWTTISKTNLNTVVIRCVAGGSSAEITAPPGAITVMTGTLNTTGSRVRFKTTVKFVKTIFGISCAISLDRTITVDYNSTTKTYKVVTIAITSATVSPGTAGCRTYLAIINGSKFAASMKIV
jgi:hypothetical protein